MTFRHFVLLASLAMAFPGIGQMSDVGQVALHPAWAEKVFASHRQPREELVDAPSVVAERREQETRALAEEPFSPVFEPVAIVEASPRTDLFPPHPEWNGTDKEPFHWKGLLLQSLAFDLLQNGVRVVTSNQRDRRQLLNKPFWSDYWASLNQFNWRRWNDGDNFGVNYVGHPIEGAIAGYLEVQNNPRDRAVQFGNNRTYWMSRLRAAGWAAVYSTQWELGPLGESAIFNQGGFTYPIRCHNQSCNANSQYTNNTGWVDMVVTPTVGTLWLIGEDVLDRYVTDRLVSKHPKNFGYKVLRSGANPSRSLANMLRGRYPWYRDYENPTEYESPVLRRFNEEMAREPQEHVDIFGHFSDLSLRTNRAGCTGCRRWVRGGGVGVGVQVRRYLDLIADVSILPDASPESSLNIGGTLTAASFGVRSGYNRKYFALKASLAPGFASYSRAVDYPNGTEASVHRATNFQTVAAISGDIKLTRNLGFRVQVQNMLIRYKSSKRDPDGIGTPPRLSFLSHDNYINSTNWGVEMGPVLRF